MVRTASAQFKILQADVRIDRSNREIGRPGIKLRAYRRDDRQGDQPFLACIEPPIPEQQVDQIAKSKPDQSRQDTHPGDGEEVRVAAERRSQRQKRIARQPEKQRHPKRGTGARPAERVRTRRHDLRDMDIAERSKQIGGHGFGR
jgi:hypothetical protein